MSTYRWRAQEEHLLRLLLPTNTYREISEQISRRYDAGVAGFPCERSEDAVRRKCDREGWTPENQCNYVAEGSPAQQQLSEIKKIQEKYKAQSVVRNTGIMSEDNHARKILCLSDIHFPLAREDLLEQEIEDHYDADIVVLNGDIIEGYMLSVYEKHRTIALLDEYNCAFSFVERLSLLFENVVIVEGNHDNRGSRYLRSKGIPKEASQIMRPNLLARIANGEKLDATGMLIEKKDFSNVHFQSRDSWYVKIGKTIFMHPQNRGSSKPGWTVMTMGQKLLARYQPDEVDSFVCGHTHQIYQGIFNSRLYIEQGCLCDVMPYLHSPRNSSTKNFMNGYAVIYQDKDGNTDFNKSGYVFLGEALPPKKEIVF